MFVYNGQCGSDEVVALLFPTIPHHSPSFVRGGGVMQRARTTGAQLVYECCMYQLTTFFKFLAYYWLLYVYTHVVEFRNPNSRLHLQICALNSYVTP
jgi:hypothetical protein